LPDCRRLNQLASTRTASPHCAGRTAASPTGTAHNPSAKLPSGAQDVGIHRPGMRLHRSAPPRHNDFARALCSALQSREHRADFLRGV